MGQLGGGGDTEQFGHGAEQVDGVDGAVFDLFAASVRGADDVAALESAAGHERGEDGAVVSPAAIPRGFPLHFWSAAELAVPPDDSAIQQAALREILEQG